jgi:hypothetical protein
MLATSCGGRGVHHTRAARLLVVAVVITGHECGLLMVLLAPLFAALGTLLGILDDDVGQCFPTATWSRMKLGSLVADSLLGSDAMQLLDGVLDGVDRCLEGLYQWHVARRF